MTAPSSHGVGYCADLVVLPVWGVLFYNFWNVYYTLWQHFFCQVTYYLLKTVNFQMVKTPKFEIRVGYIKNKGFFIEVRRMPGMWEERAPWEVETPIVLCSCCMDLVRRPVLRKITKSFVWVPQCANAYLIPPMNMRASCDMNILKFQIVSAIYNTMVANCSRRGGLFVISFHSF